MGIRSMHNFNPYLSTGFIYLYLLVVCILYLPLLGVYYIYLPLVYAYDCPEGRIFVLSVGEGLSCRPGAFSMQTPRGPRNKRTL